jgi:hypothetical protein
MGRAITMYLLDDVAALRLVPRTVLELEGMTVVGEAGDGAVWIGEIAELQPDVFEKGEPLERVVVGLTRPDVRPGDLRRVS